MPQYRPQSDHHVVVIWTNVPPSPCAQIVGEVRKNKGVTGRHPWTRLFLLLRANGGTTKQGPAGPKASRTCDLWTHGMHQTENHKCLMDT